MATATQLLGSASRRLVESGFRKHKSEIFTLELSPNVSGWLGLNTARRGLPASAIRVNPVVGVRDDRVEDLLTELTRRARQPYVSTTISTPIGYAMPKNTYVEWELSAEDDQAEKDLVAAVWEFGVPFMQKHQSLEDLLSAARARLGHQPEYRIPIICYLMNDVEGAHAALRSQLAKYTDQTITAANNFRAFAQNLGERLTSAVAD